MTSSGTASSAKAFAARKRLRRLNMLPCLFLLMPGISLAQPPALDRDAAAFKFTKPDLTLLDDSNQLDAQFQKKGLVLQDPTLQQYLDRVGQRIIGNRPTPENVHFQFKALRDPMVNAFALPNGSVYITTGLLSLLENEAQLASVFDHETSHVYDRHSYLENRSARGNALAANILAIAGSAVPIGPGLGSSVLAFGAGARLASAMGSVALTASVYGYSRDKESEADSNGLAAMVAAGYDPHAMARAFELLDQDSTLEYEPIDSFYHDHPKLTERRELALQFASQHTPAITNAGTAASADTEQDYLTTVAPAVSYNIAADIESRRARTALARANRLASAFPDNPHYQVLLGDAYAALGARSPTPTADELTPAGQAEHRKEHLRMTEQAEQTTLLAQPDGAATLRANQARAEELYLAVAQNHPDQADAYRELGFLYERQARYSDAAAEYRRYLDLVASTSLDYLRIQRRLAAIEKLAAPQPH